MSGAVGSIPSLTRSGAPSERASFELRGKRPRGQAVHGAPRQLVACAGASLAAPGIRSGRALGGSRQRPCCGRRGELVGSAAAWAAADARLSPPVELATLPSGSRSRLKKLRFFLIFLALLLLGLVSFAFGMFMAVASDLPGLENQQQYNNARNSVLLDDRGREIGVLSQQNQILVTPQQIPPIVKEAVISIEDKRFMTNSGVDLRSTARAFMDDLLHQGAVQGASTIEQQFVKNALQEQAHRTIFEKLREAALAFHLAHKWSKEKIITEYLNTIYFGNGAYGIEAAARTYFGQDVNHLGCGTPKHRLCVESSSPGRRRCWPGSSSRRPTTTRSQHPAAARRRGATSCSGRCSSRATSRSPSMKRACSSRCRPRRTSQRPTSR